MIDALFFMSVRIALHLVFARYFTGEFQYSARAFFFSAFLSLHAYAMIKIIAVLIWNTDTSYSRRIYFRPRTTSVCTNFRIPYILTDAYRQYLSARAERIAANIFLRDKITLYVFLSPLSPFPLSGKTLRLPRARGEGSCRTYFSHGGSARILVTIN